MTAASRVGDATSGRSDQRVSLQLSSPSACIRLGAGLRRNALRTPDWVELERLVNTLEQRADVTAVVVRGLGHTFSSGSDLTEWTAVDAAYVDRTFAAMESALSSLERLNVVSIAAIEGAATGAACELALACDLRVMSRSARIGMPVLRHGIRISPTFALRLSEIVGVARARDLLFTGRLVGAIQADQWGLVSCVTEDEMFEECVSQLVESVTALPRGALSAAKDSTNRVLQARRDQLADAGWSYVDEPEFFHRISGFLSRPI